MKMPTDLVKMYKEIHGWVGIISGLALFIAFYAGAITMFENQVQRWASPPAPLAAPPSLEQTPELVAKLIAAHPEVAKAYEINLVIDEAHPARISWTTAEGEEAEHGGGTKFYAALDENGALQITSEGPSPIAQYIDILHQQVGLMIDSDIAMPIMGAISLLYFVAIISGIIVLLPSLVNDLYAMRLGKNVKRMWLDVHNLLGIFSLPFHIIMALTAVVFAFHDQFYDAQGVVFGGTERERPAAVASASPQPTPLTPEQILESLQKSAPGFTPYVLNYSSRGGEMSLRVLGGDPHYALRGPTFGTVMLDPITGEIKGKDYLPGHQDGWSATVTSFFALHFGNFGGAPIRWAYFLLGLGGAALFYTGNLLWVESRRKRERKNGAVEQTRATRILGALTVSVPLGCIAGIALALAAAKPLGLAATESAHSIIYHMTFLGFVLWSLVRGAARSGYELAIMTAITLVTIPISTLVTMNAHPPVMIGVDITALALAVTLLVAARSAWKRAQSLPRDSVWSRANSHNEQAHNPVAEAF